MRVSGMQRLRADGINARFSSATSPAGPAAQDPTTELEKYLEIKKLGLISVILITIISLLLMLFNWVVLFGLILIGLLAVIALWAGSNFDAPAVLEKLVKLFKYVADSDLTISVSLLPPIVYVPHRLEQRGRDLKEQRVPWAEARLDTLLQCNFEGSVCGPPGSGKTTFLRYLIHDHFASSQSLWTLLIRDRTQKKVLENALYNYNLNADRKIEGYLVTGMVERLPVAHFRFLTDTPGYEEQTISKIEKEIERLSRFPRAMIVNTLCYGFGARIRKTSELEIKKYGKNDEGIQNFVSDFRKTFLEQDEVDSTEFIVRAIENWPKSSRTKIVLVNMINMAGFWWDRRAEVEEYYRGHRSEKFREFGARLAAARPAGLLHYVPYVPVSLLFDNMEHETMKNAQNQYQVLYRVQHDAKAELDLVNLKNIRKLRENLYRTNFGIPQKGRA